MSFLSVTTQFLGVSSHSRRLHGGHVPDDVDEYLSSDLEASFASNVSLNSPPRESIALTSDNEYHPMDISPLPLVSRKPITRPRASTSAARLFGNDISNKFAATPYHEAPVALKGGSNSGSKRIQRTALPFEWMMNSRSQEPKEDNSQEYASTDDAMDVDTSFEADASPTVALNIIPASAGATVTSFSNLFYDSTSPRRSFESPAARHQHKKRRSHSPETLCFSAPEEASSSPNLASSPSQRKLERIATGPVFPTFHKPTLDGLGLPPQSNVLKRPRRPVLSAMVHPSDSLHSTHPVLGQAFDDCRSADNGMPPTRRAFSALLPPPSFTEHMDESSFESSEASSPAQAYAKRQNAKTIRRCDGTEDFRPLTGATAMVMNESPSRSLMGPAIPGFGDNEAHGKILPCHRVSEDGLMRINAQTLDDLLDGKFDHKIRDYHIIDCRFEYEYKGGHIPGAVNLNTTAQVEAELLGYTLFKPKPSVSGDSIKKSILVFHCEFSAMRAPTFAKHLRSKDRLMNNHVYPKIHFPEVYILEGGYCQYFKISAPRCQPSAYVRMDDPTHAASRREDLDQFRKAKFGRHKSYAYGDSTRSSSATLSQQAKRNTAPSGAPSLFAAATAARSRRSGSVSLTTLAEDANTTCDGDETDTDLGDSPCPPPAKAMANRKQKIRMSLTRAETYGPSRMPV